MTRTELEERERAIADHLHNLNGKFVGAQQRVIDIKREIASEAAKLDGVNNEIATLVYKGQWNDVM